MTELIDEYNAKEKFVAAAIIEPIQAEGGQSSQTFACRRSLCNSAFAVKFPEVFIHKRVLHACTAVFMGHKFCSFIFVGHLLLQFVFHLLW